MRPRQIIPRQWLIIKEEGAIGASRRVPLNCGVLVLVPLSARGKRRLRQIARQRSLVVEQENPRSAVRVHDFSELTRARLRRTPMILLSPLYPTQSHPDWKPIARMRAAALARLGRRELFALGGMDARKFAQIKSLGFQGWAGISAFRT